MNRDLLEKPFSADQIKQRPGDHGDILDYLEGATVIQRLNEAFNSEWSFEIIEHLIQEKEVLVSGRLTANGFTKTQFGNKTRESSVGDDLKAAATDCIKKCATLFGIGLHLYFSETTTVPAPPPPPVQHSPYPLPKPNGSQPRPEPGSGNGTDGSLDGRLTAKQLSAIFAITKGMGWSSKETRGYTQDRFNKLPDFLTKREASTCIDALKAGAR
jgi:Rad52/22 family double-strand break repair protein